MVQTELTSLQQLPDKCLNAFEPGGSGREELEMAFLFPYCPVIHEILLTKNPDKSRK